MHNSSVLTSTSCRLAATLLLSTIAILAAGPAAATTIAESTFDADLDGWVYNDSTNAQFTFEAVGGNPGGFAQFVDSSVASNNPLINAPSTFLGDWSTYDNIGRISFDQILINAGDVANFEALGIRIQGTNGSQAVFRTTPPNIGATGVWITTIAPLRESDWTVSGGTWASLLADVSELEILVERVQNSGSRVETVGTDNVRLFLVPEPGTSLLFGVGLLGLAGRRGWRLDSGLPNSDGPDRRVAKR